MVLFGSRARGDATKDSDYDVAIFVKEGGAGTVLDRQLSNIAFPYLLKGVHIRPVSLPRDFLNSGFQYPLAFSIAREGVLLS